MASFVSRIVPLAFFAALLWIPTSWAQEANYFLMVNPGEEAATSERAGDFLDRLGRYLHDTVPPLQERPIRGWVTNRRDSVQAYLRRDPVLAFVPPSVYLRHLQNAEHATPIAEIPRFGASSQRYHLVVPADGPRNVQGLRDGVIRVPDGTDRGYLWRVAFPSGLDPESDVRLEETSNMDDEVFLMTEGPMGDDTPADALLFDEDLKRFYEDDDLVWPRLTVIWSSSPLPRDLVVTLGPSWDESSRKGLRKALFEMPNRDDGAALLKLMNSSGFAPLNEERLSDVAREYDAK